MKLKRRCLRKKKFRAEYGLNEETQSKSDPRVKRCDYLEGKSLFKWGSTTDAAEDRAEPSWPAIRSEISGHAHSGDILGNLVKIVTLMAVTPADTRAVKKDGERK